jgi:general stress protein 26
MARKAADRDVDNSAGHNEKLQDLFQLIDGIETGLLTTRRADGRLVSRPMATQLRTEAGHLWFVTDRDTHKVDELEADSNVNVAYYNNRTREWVSVSGRARATRDQSMIDALWAPDWTAWFGKGGGKHSGTAKDPRLLLIEVIPDSVTYMKTNQPAIVSLFKVAKGMVTGEQPKFGDLREVTGAEIEEGRTKPGARSPGRKSSSSAKTTKKSAKKTSARGRKRSSR